MVWFFHGIRGLTATFFELIGACRGFIGGLAMFSDHFVTVGFANPPCVA